MKNVMIEEVHLAKVGSYGDAIQRLHGLQAINFLFGSNGSGKTTISRVIADPHTHPSCAIVWRKGQALEALVYNRDFVARNFSQQVQGIFTLGEDAAGKIAEIENARLEIEQIEEEIRKLRGTLGAPESEIGKYAERRALRKMFEEECWSKMWAPHDAHFNIAFSGTRNSRSKFCQRVLEKKSANSVSLHPVESLEDLKERARTVFARDAAKLPTLPVINGADVLNLEQSAILTKKVVGKEDIAISTLVRRLGNSDWVRAGLEYVEGVGSPCPFCQKALDAELLEKLNEFFDEAYRVDIEEIARIEKAYGADSGRLIEAVDHVLASGSPYVDIVTLQPMREQLHSLIALNKGRIEHKRREPSVPIILESLRELIGDICVLVERANAKIAGHNDLIDNKPIEQDKLCVQIWRYLFDENKDFIDNFITNDNNLGKTIDIIKNKIDDNDRKLSYAKLVLSSLEDQVTSVQPAVTRINHTLASFGFTNFKLETSGEKNQFYKIVRSDGHDAIETLSEGERSFITFLYFYHLIRGSTTASGVNVDRVVVFDDPVSSLDSDVLFVVSSLIKKVLDEAEAGDGRIKQVFVLTHNIYFHKQVSFDKKRQLRRRAHETFWIVRKAGYNTVLDRYEKNPINTSYELLWEQVKLPNRSNLTIQNVLRRILEGYFIVFGNMDKNSIIAKFNGHDQQICASLFSWLDAGSHNFSEDTYLLIDDSTVARYLDVFKRIFVETHHGAHYAMMMGEEASSP